MALPNMTLVYLKNWLERFGATKSMVERYEKHWVRIDDPNASTATPIPCPNYFLSNGTFGDGQYIEGPPVHHATHLPAWVFAGRERVRAII